MRLVFLHGAPATGKLTVARAILSLLPGRRLENHAAIDFAKNMFDSGAPGFGSLCTPSGFPRWKRRGNTAYRSWSPHSAIPTRKIDHCLSSSRRL